MSLARKPFWKILCFSSEASCAKTCKASSGHQSTILSSAESAWAPTGAPGPPRRAKPLQSTVGKSKTSSQQNGHSNKQWAHCRVGLCAAMRQYLAPSFSAQCMRTRFGLSKWDLMNAAHRLYKQQKQQILAFPVALGIEEAVCLANLGSRGTPGSTKGPKVPKTHD